MKLFRDTPVYFQPLEQELEPVAPYLHGHMLNAGCGTRDITAFLRGHGVTELTRFDLASDDPEVVVGRIESLPFEDASFDSILCNAVLEHVDDAERSMRELARVVRKGGHVVVAIPFLQPYHPCPGDFRRFTVDGMAQLGQAAGLEVVTILPVHSIAQTIGWILWEYAREKGGLFRRALIWTLVLLATRVFHRTDKKLGRSANTFQAVFRRPESEEAAVLGTTWRKKPVPVESSNVPTMLVPDELRLLNHIAEEIYTGEGAIVDAGSFLGGSTVALAAGLRHNPHRHRFAGTKPIHSYDRFEVEDWTRGVFFPETTPAGSSFRADFDRNIAPFADLVDVHAGDITSHPWHGGPIELLFIDVAKHWVVCDWITWQFFPHLIPGRSLVIQQDYLYHHWVGWLHVTMEYYADYFTYVCDTDVNSVVFLNTKKIPADVLQRHTVERLPDEMKAELMTRAADRFTGKKRDMLLAAKAHFLEMLKAS